MKPFIGTNQFKYDNFNYRKQFFWEDRPCEVCGEMFSTYKASSRKYCSRKCVVSLKIKYHTKEEREAARKVMHKRHMKKYWLTHRDERIKKNKEYYHSIKIRKPEYYKEKSRRYISRLKEGGKYGEYLEKMRINSRRFYKLKKLQSL